MIHFTAGDRVANDADHFQGWWKIEYFGRTEYYRFEKSGRVRWTSKPPKASTDRIDANAKNLGHIKVNQHKGTATKLFT